MYIATSKLSSLFYHQNTFREHSQNDQQTNDEIKELITDYI